MLCSFQALITLLCSQSETFDECYCTVETFIFTYVDCSVTVLILFIIVIMQLIEQHNVVQQLNKFVSMRVCV